MRDEIPVTPEEEAAWREMEQRQAQQATQHQASGPAGAPDRIFLVIGEYVPANTPFGTLAEVTWCADRVNDTDIEYVRAQPAAAMPDEIEGLRAHVALLKAALAQAERENDELRAQPAAITVPAGEREAFEAWVRVHRPYESLRRKFKTDPYVPGVQCYWEAWQARAALAAQAAPAVLQWPRVLGVSRDLHPRCLMVSLAAEPTDDQVRAIHAALTTQGASHDA